MPLQDPELQSLHRFLYLLALYVHIVTGLGLDLLLPWNILVVCSQLADLAYLGPILMGRIHRLLCASCAFIVLGYGILSILNVINSDAFVVKTRVLAMCSSAATLVLILADTQRLPLPVRLESMGAMALSTTETGRAQRRTSDGLCSTSDPQAQNDANHDSHRSSSAPTLPSRFPYVSQGSVYLPGSFRHMRLRTSRLHLNEIRIIDRLSDSDLPANPLSLVRLASLPVPALLLTFLVRPDRDLCHWVMFEPCTAQCIVNVVLTVQDLGGMLYIVLTAHATSEITAGVLDQCVVVLCIGFSRKDCGKNAIKRVRRRGGRKVRELRERRERRERLQRERAEREDAQPEEFEDEQPKEREDEREDCEDEQTEEPKSDEVVPQGMAYAGELAVPDDSKTPEVLTSGKINKKVPAKKKAQGWCWWRDRAAQRAEIKRREAIARMVTGVPVDATA